MLEPCKFSIYMFDLSLEEEEGEKLSFMSMGQN